MALLAGVFTASAQDQERKLMDRLLKPNTALANSAQDKKFVAAGVPIDKQAPSRGFYSPEKAIAKPFTGERAFSPKQFAARHFRAGDSAANISSRSQLTKSDTVNAAPVAPGVRVAPDSGATVAVRQFAGNRPFLDRGKSQKFLNTNNPPMTIEQVRELLNKSK
ncbi:MAG: hypothetical protein DLM73_10555 [Chthoniobacterales bacterium]|nr:MAG: hypothetical protein DLM73_10555 [Chthoniobacterales bacterium]